MNKISFLILLCLFLFTDASIPQQSQLSKGVNEISIYIASGYFKEISASVNDLALIDSIYLKALSLNNYDYSETLLALCFATIPYREVPIRIPLLNLIVNYPLLSAPDSVYQMKNENLPMNIFFDSPQDNYGDKDKLAHFFGSAFLSYNSLFFDLGNLFGYFVEAFEEDFKVQSSIDERDLITNNLGFIFGSLLKSNKKILPSSILIMHSLSNFSYSL
jgi:hypothetical protein